MKKSTIAYIIIGIVLVGLAVYFFISGLNGTTPVTPEITPAATTTTQAQTPVDKTKTVIGTSVENRPITAYHYGTGTKEILFVGGIHGGYEWNTSLLAFELMDYLKANPAAIPANIKVTVMPVLNPDGLNRVTGTADRFTATSVSKSSDVVISGRYNGNNVDLNRNFDCDWQTTGVWMNTAVSGGKSAFSEPETLAFKNYVETNNPTAAVVWFSSASGVFPSSCDGAPSPETLAITNLYAKASGYKEYKSFDFYETTGDIVNWMAKKNIPGISVLLTTHQDTEFSKNIAGVNALLAHYSK